jgi:hypothetical protein
MSRRNICVHVAFGCTVRLAVQRTYLTANRPAKASMRNEPIIEEIHRIRDGHAAKFNYDLHAIFEDIQRMERESGRIYVTYPPRRPRSVTVTAASDDEK